MKSDLLHQKIENNSMKKGFVYKKIDVNTKMTILERIEWSLRLHIN